MYKDLVEILNDDTIGCDDDSDHIDIFVIPPDLDELTDNEEMDDDAVANDPSFSRDVAGSKEI